MTFWKFALPLSGLAVVVSPIAFAQTTPAAPNGALLFKQRCSTCHASKKGAPTTLGPNLVSVAGRKAGATAFNYSPAMKASKVIWTKPNLDKFIAGPTKMIPGTRMVISVTDAKQRAAIADYVATLK